MSFEITFAENPTVEELGVLETGLDRFTEEMVGDRKTTPLTYFLRSETGDIVGGVHGNYGTFGWLYVSMLWVAESLRGEGYGAALMLKIEEEAKNNGCENSYLDTFSYQAPGFYKKLGYVVFGDLKDFPTGHSRIFLRKRLVK